MISSDEHIADRPLRNHIHAVVFAMLTVMAVVVLGSALFFHVRHRVPGPEIHPQVTPPPAMQQPR